MQDRTIVRAAAISWFLAIPNVVTAAVVVQRSKSFFFFCCFVLQNQSPQSAASVDVSRDRGIVTVSDEATATGLN